MKRSIRFIDLRADHRPAEIAQILEAGLLRALKPKSSAVSAGFSETSLDLSPGTGTVGREIAAVSK